MAARSHFVEGTARTDTAITSERALQSAAAS